MRDRFLPLLGAVALVFVIMHAVVGQFARSADYAQQMRWRADLYVLGDGGLEGLPEHGTISVTTDRRMARLLLPREVCSETLGSPLTGNPTPCVAGGLQR